MTDQFPADDSLTDHELFEQVILFYRQRLKDHAAALTYLQDRGLTHPELLEQFEIGFADRAFGRTLPGPQLAAGKRLRSRL
jgi:DNA primase